MKGEGILLKINKTLNGLKREGSIPSNSMYFNSKTGEFLFGDNNDIMPEKPSTGDRYTEGDYTYIYNRGGDYGTEWNVLVQTKSKSSYGPILSEIAGRPVTNLPKVCKMPPLQKSLILSGGINGFFIFQLFNKASKNTFLLNVNQSAIAQWVSCRYGPASVRR